MYENHWQLNQKPFEDVVQGNSYFPSAPHQGASLKLRYAVENKRGAAVLTGVAGVGKSLLVNQLMEQMTEEFKPKVHAVFPQLPADQLIKYLTAEICQIEPLEELQANVRQLESFLKRNAEDGNHAVLAVDEAHLLDGPTTLEALRLLLNFEHAGRRCLTMLLVGQPQILTYLSRCPGLDDRVAVKSLVRPLNAQETIDYIDHRLESAGAQRPIFNGESKTDVFQLSGGIPRRINHICDLALLVGFAEQKSEIDAAQIQALAEEIVTVRPEAA